jgi:hypothetical protein
MKGGLIEMGTAEAHEREETERIQEIVRSVSSFIFRAFESDIRTRRILESLQDFSDKEDPWKAANGMVQGTEYSEKNTTPVRVFDPNKGLRAGYSSKMVYAVGRGYIRDDNAIRPTLFYVDTWIDKNRNVESMYLHKRLSLRELTEVD